MEEIVSNPAGFIRRKESPCLSFAWRASTRNV